MVCGDGGGGVCVYREEDYKGIMEINYGLCIPWSSVQINREKI